MSYSAVLFDLGGVVCESPLLAISEFERARNLPPGVINAVVAKMGSQGAWAMHERGELSFTEFRERFEAELATEGATVDVAALMSAIEAAVQPRPPMLDAIRGLRSSGYAIGAVTNNWVRWEGSDTLRDNFDVFVESAVEGVRKPDPRIYEIATSRLGAPPEEVVFLDDIGANLKPARAMGMATIKVDDPERALEDLYSLLSKDS